MSSNNSYHELSGDGKSCRGGKVCELCSVFVPNDASWNAHLKGQKHLRNFEKQKEWKNKAEHSVYVGGIKKLTAAELSLADYFGRFCGIKKITIDKTQRCYAIVEFESREAVNTILQITKHEINGISVNVKPREIKANNKVNPVVKTTCSTEESAISNELWKKILLTNSVDEQIWLLQKRLELTADDLRLRNLLCQLLQSALQEAFPGCLIKQFGSSVSGFGFYNCDLDLHLQYDQVHPDILKELSSQNNSSNNTKPSGSSYEIAESNSDVLLAVAEIIKQCVPDCHKIKTIVNARLPVIRFHHKSSKMKCDISLSNHLAVRNTEYLQFCCHLLSDFKPLVFVVRSWMKHWELAGGIHVNGPRLNNYAVTLLVLFYLQHSHRMPSLPDIVEATGNGPKTYIFGWDCTFPDTIDVLKEKTDNFSKAPLVELVADFFTFYSKVEFSKTVLDLKTACFIEIDDFMNDATTPKIPQCDGSTHNESVEAVMKLPGRNNRRFRMGSLNIRDPFELTHNVAANVSQKHVKTLTKCIRNASFATKMRKYRIKPTSGNSPWGILNCFIDHHSKNTDDDAAGNITATSTKATEHCFCIKQPGIDIDFNKWCQLTGGYVLTVLRDVFAMSVIDKEDTEAFVKQSSISTPTNVEVSSGGGNGSGCIANNVDENATNARKRRASSPACSYCKRAKVLLSSPVSPGLSSAIVDRISLPYTVLCTATHRLWKGRRKARRRLVNSCQSDLLQLEMSVSRLLLSDKAQDLSRESVTMDYLTNGAALNTSASSSGSLNDSVDDNSVFTFSLHLDVADESSLRLAFVPTSNSTDFATFYHHLKEFLPGFLVKYTKTKCT